MAVKFFNPAWILLGTALCVALSVAALILRRRNARRTGVRAANTARLRALPIYRRKRAEGLICRALLAVGLIVSLAASLALAARPYRTDTVKEDVTRKDIFLCMDISASGCAGLSGFVEALEQRLPGLEGDQIGVSLFNTSSVQFVPVTEDYRFAGQRLGELADYLRAAEEFQRDFADVYAYAHEIPQEERARYEALNATLSAFDRGATAGYEKKGTSAIDEGLAACLFSFPELHTEARPRVIVFVTDNLPEYVDDPLTTLEEVADMCAYDGVTVYSVYPGGVIAPEGRDVEQAKAQMKKVAETTGGSFFDLGGDADAEQILDQILSHARADSRTVIATRDADAPEGWNTLLFAGMGAVLAVLAWLLAKGGWRALPVWPWRRRLLTAMALLAALGCAAMIAVRPMRMDDDPDFQTTNLDVCFAVDTTISMWAEDHQGDQTRMSGVKEDVAQIMEALPGSSFSLIRFDNGAQTLAPYVQNIAVVTDCMAQLSLPAYATAEGSSLNAVHDALAAMIRASEEKAGARRTIVFLMSDGEITDGSELMSFRDLSRGVDDGAVLGYGTEAGGRMNYPGRGYIQDTQHQTDARSVLDEANLKAVARDLSVPCVIREERNDRRLTQLLSRVRRMSRRAALQSGDRTGWLETYYYYAGALALILMGCLYRLLRRGSVL